MGPSGKPKLEGEDFILLKQKLREQSKKIKGMVVLRLREMGENASLKTEPESRVPLFLTDIQHLITYSQVKNSGKIKKASFKFYLFYLAWASCSLLSSKMVFFE